MTKCIKCTAVGDPSFGKSCLETPYSLNLKREFFQSEILEQVIPFSTVKYSQGDGGEVSTIQLNIWDTSVFGNEDHQNRGLVVYPNTNVILLCFSIVIPTSFQNLGEKWYPEVKHFCPNIPIVVVGTMMDLREDKTILEELRGRNLAPITYEEGMQLAKKVRAVKYLECSGDDSLNQVFQEVIKTALFPPEKTLAGDAPEEEDKTPSMNFEAKQKENKEKKDKKDKDKKDKKDKDKKDKKDKDKKDKETFGLLQRIKNKDKRKTAFF